MKEGEQGHEFFIILDGVCQVITEEAGGVIAELHSGDYCGEQALLQSCVRAASIKCETPTTCCVIEQKSFQALLGAGSKVVFANRSAKRAAVVSMPAPVRRVDRKSMIKPTGKRDWILECISGNLLFETMEEPQKLAIVDRMHLANVNS